MEDAINDERLSLMPEAPSPAQCCGGGCSPCVYDLYAAELKLWERAKEKDDPDLLRPISKQGRCEWRRDREGVHPHQLRPRQGPF